MAATSLESIRRIEIEARSKGLDEVAAKLDKVAKAQEGVVASSTSVEKSSGSVEQAFKRTERSLDTNIVAYDKYARSVKAVVDAQAQGLVSQQRSAELISLAETRLNKATGTMDKFGKSVAGPAQHELINLSRQLQDVGVGLAGGQGLFTIIAQQGPQIADVLATSKASVGDFVSTAVAGAGRFLLAWGPLAAAVGAVGAGAFAAMRTLGQEREARIATTSGLGRFLGAGPADIAGAADRSRAPGTSLGEAREGVLTFARAGADSLEIIVQANAMAQRYATTLNMDLAPAQKELAQAMAEPGKGVDALNAKLKFLTATQIDHVKTLAANNKETEAGLFILQKMQPALLSAADATTGWGQVWADVVTQMQKGLDVLGRIATFQQPPPTTAGGQAAAQQGAAIRNNAGFATAIQGETPRGGTTTASGDAQALAAELAQVAAAYGQVAAAATKAAIEQDKIANTIRKATEAHQDQVAVMMAVTVSQRAAATESQVYNEAIRNNVNEEVAFNQALLAGNLVRAQAAAQQQQAIAAQQQELAMGSQLIAAAGQQGAAGVALRAGLQEELAIRKAGLDATSADSRARIANAEAIASQTLAIQDATQAAQTRAQLGDQLETLRLENSLIEASAEVRARATSAMQTEIQARQAERQGLTETAAAYREYKDAIASAAAAKAAAASGGGGYEMAGGGDPAGRAGDLFRFGPITALGDAANSATQRLKELMPAASETGMKMEAQAAAVQRATNATDRFASALDGASREAASASFSAGGDKPMSQRGGFTSVLDIGGAMAAARDKEKAAEQQVFDQMRDAQKAGQQRQLQNASSAIQDQISALQDQKSGLDDNTQALEDNVSALEKETEKRRAQLDKQIDKLEKALNPSRPDPYAERNPDYFYRFGTQAFKENDPTQALLMAAEAERDGLDNQLDAMKEQLDQQKKAVELQQKAIDTQISGYEAQARQLDRAASLLSAGVELSGQEVAGLQSILAAIGGLGDYSRLQAANVQQTEKAMGDIFTAHPQAPQYASAQEMLLYGRAQSAARISSYGFQSGYGSGFSGFFAAGGYIPPGSWGIAGESGPEVISKKRAIAGPATVTPIGSGSRPIVVNQTIVSQGGMRELRASRGELAQRSSSEVRRSLGAR